MPLAVPASDRRPRRHGLAFCYLHHRHISNTHQYHDLRHATTITEELAFELCIDLEHTVWLSLLYDLGIILGGQA